MTLLQRATLRDATILTPAAVGTVGMGAIAAQTPPAGAGLGMLAAFTLMPWRALFFLMTLAAILNRYRFDVGGVTLKPAHLLIVPLAVRAFLFMRDEFRPRFRWPEWAIIGFIGAQLFSSFFFAEDRLKSFLVTGLLALGVLAYLAIYAGLVTRRRLIDAARVVLLMGAVNCGVALMAAAGHYLLGTNWGVSVGGTITPVAGLAYEYNILGSMSACAAIAFLVLMREPNPLVSRRTAALGFWVCFASLLVSLTRGAWIAFALTLVITLFIQGRAVRRRQDRRRQVGLVGLALGVAALGVFSLVASASDSAAPNPILYRGSQLANIETGSGAGRVSEWKLALDEVRGSLVFGLGTNSYGQRHETPKKRVEEQKGAYIGNLYIRALYDSGVVGLSFLLVFLAGILWHRREVLRSTGDLATVSRAFTLAYLALAVAYTTTDASYQTWPWIILGVARVATSQAMQQHRAQGRAAAVSPNGDDGSRPTS